MLHKNAHIMFIYLFIYLQVTEWTFFFMKS